MTPQEILVGQEAFIARLRRHRERNRVPLEEIASTLRLKPEWLQAFERNDLTDWPRGLYARAWIRGYATVIGLDPIDTVDEFCRLFPHGDRRAGRTVVEVADLVAQPSEYRDDMAPEPDRRNSPEAIPVAPTPPAWPIAVARAVYQLWIRWMPAVTSRRADPGSARRATP
jgi:cytoskeletal protein RodZ